MPDDSVSNAPMSGRGDPTVRIGFFGKVPARGDFVRAGLSRDATRIWDEWMQRVLPAAEVQLGEVWISAWSVAPVWRFALPAGQLGPHCVLGVWLPSVDSAGRQFPLMIAAEGAIDDQGFLECAEQVGRDTIAFDVAPKALLHRLHAVAAPQTLSRCANPTGRWWTEGGPFVRPQTFEQESLPTTATFAGMVHS
jgi:type VI secretion system protein ImpM